LKALNVGIQGTVFTAETVPLQSFQLAISSSISTSIDGESIAVDYLNYQLPPNLLIRQGQDLPKELQVTLVSAFPSGHSWGRDGNFPERLTPVVSARAIHRLYEQKQTAPERAVAC